MKVLHLISGGDSGGAKTHVLSLLQNLNKSITADLVCYMEADFAREARELGIPVTVFPDGFVSGLHSTEKLIRAKGYDLVHCHGSRANLIGSILKRKFDIPFISTVHSDYKLDYLGRPLAKLTYGKLNAYALRKLDYRVCVSDETMDMMISRDFAPNDMYTIFNGVDYSVETKRDNRKKRLSDIGCDFPEDAVIVGIGARLDPVKNVASLIRAFATAQKGNDELRLLIAGDGLERDMLEGLAKDLGIAEKVYFAGWLTDMDAYYSVVDINVICSLSETFPYAVTEAARARIPTVASRVGGLPKLVIPEETGLLFEPDDSDALAKHILRLANDAALRKKLGDAVFEKARSEYSLEKTCATQLEIYASVLRRHRRKAAHERSGIVVCGAYGHGNAGDEAILTELLSQLRTLDEDAEITVISKVPKLTQRMHRINSVARGNIPAAVRCMKRARLFVSGGGSLIQDVTSSRSLYYYLYTIKKAKKCGCMVQMYGCGMGPLTKPINAKQAAYIINRYVDTVTTRDPLSAKTLERIGATKPKTVLAADPVVAIAASPPSEVEKYMLQNGLLPDGKYVCINLRRWAGTHEKLPEVAAALRKINEQSGLTPVLLPMNESEDLPALSMLSELYGGDCVCLDVIEQPELAIGFMSKMSAVIAMRLHALLYASLGGAAIVGLSYDPKVESFIEYMGCGVSLNFESLGADALAAATRAELASPQLSNRAALKAAESANIEQARLLYNTFDA